MSNLAAMLIGAAIDRRDGDSGVKGAITGLLAASAVRVAVPIIATYAVGWLVLKGAGKLAEKAGFGNGDDDRRAQA